VSRWVSSLNEAAAARDDICGCWFLDLDFASGHARANDSGMDFAFGGNTYSGVGDFGTFSEIEESVEFVARGLRAELSGVNSGIITTLKNDVYQGRSAYLYIGLIDPKTYLLVDTPELRWSGFMDTMDIEIGVKASTIQMACEHRMRATPPFSRWSDTDQKARSAGDRIFDQTHLVDGFTSVWAGGRSTTWEGRPGGGYGPG
jgi:hypothetical protein